MQLCIHRTKQDAHTFVQFKRPSRIQTQCANQAQTHTNVSQHTHVHTQQFWIEVWVLPLFLSSQMAVSLPDVNFDSDDGDIDPTPPVIDDTRILSEKFADTIFGCALASVNFLVYVGICMFPLVCDHGCSWRATFPSRPREPGRSNSCFLACPPVKGQGHIYIMNYLNQETFTSEIEIIRIH